MKKYAIAILSIFIFLSQPLPLVNASQKVLTFDCVLVEYKPSSLTDACIDGGDGLRSIKWVSWGPSSAIGYGFHYHLLCNGSQGCANGQLIQFPVKIILNQVKNLRSQKYFTNVQYFEIDKQKNIKTHGESGGWNLYQLHIQDGGR